MNGLSIRARLTLLYAGSVLLMLGVAALGMRVVLRDGLEAEFRRSQSSTVALIQHQFAVEREGYSTADSAAVHLVGEVLFPDREVTLFDPAHRAAVPIRRRPAVVLDPPLRLTEAPLDSASAPGWTVRVTQSAAGLVRAARRLDRGLAFGVVLGSVLAGFAGWWLTGRTLAPVGRMAQAAEGIDAGRSSARLPIADGQDELGRLGIAFNQLLDRLDQALGQQRQFLADAAHELRTPIARILTQLEVMSAPSAPPVSADAVAGLRADLERTAVMLDELLQLARADAGEREIRPARLFLDDLVHEAATAWRPAAERNGVTITLQVPEDEVPVVADPGLLRRLIDTLVDNAIRYSSAGEEVELGTRSTGSGAVIEVSDRGIGIASDERERVFERFFRGKRARQLAPEGSGLGLPIARWIAERHGGSVELLARAGGGTVARVTLAAAQVTAG